MGRRKISGILQYGVRKYPAAVQKLQEGGFVAVSKGYDWRDDPYELMLLQQKASLENSRIRAANRFGGNGRRAGTGSANGKNIDTFARIEGGLKVTNDAYNAMTEKSQQAYYDMVLENGIEWATSAEGQITFSKIARESARLEERANTEQKNLEDSFAKIDNEDRNTLAISAQENIMVRDMASGKGQRLKMGDYLDNITKYRPMTTNEFVEWKKNEDTSLQTGLIDEFLKENSVSHNTLRKTYIDGKEDMIQYAFIEGKIVKRSAPADSSESFIADSAQFKAGLNNLMQGKQFYEGSSVKPEAQTKSPLEVVNSIYSDIMNSSASRTQLGASLEAELLTDYRNIAAISKLGSREEKEIFLENQKKLLLVSKVVDKNFKLDKASGGGDSGSKVTAKGGDLYADTMSFFDSSESTQFVFGHGFVTDRGQRVNDINIPAIANGLDPDDLQLELDPKATPTAKKNANSIYHNKAVQNYSSTTDLYSSGGVKFDKILGSREAAKSFFANDVVIAPNETMPLLFMPMDKQGNMVAPQMASMWNVKLYARREFIKSVKGRLGNINITTAAEDLLPGNLDKKANADIIEYNNWLKKGFAVEKYKEAYYKDKSAVNTNNYIMAQEAKKVINSTSYTFAKKFGSNPIQMQPMLGVWVLFDDDNLHVKEALDKHPGNKLGNKMIFKASGPEKEFIQDVNGIENNSMLPSNVYKTMVFSKVKSLSKAAAEAGESLPSVAVFADIQDKMLKKLGIESEASNPDHNNIALFLMH